MSSPDMEEAGWVPLQNTFSVNLARRRKEEEEEGRFQFTVSKGASDTQLQLAFTGSIDSDGEHWELTEEMSFDKLQALHQQMTELYPDEITEDLLPQLPSVPRGIWSYLLSVEIRDTLYSELSQYLLSLATLCSVENILAVFFADSFSSPSSYEDEWSELNRRQYQDEREDALRQWEELLARKKETEFHSMRQLHDYYEEEDFSEYHLKKVEEKLHTFQTRPFEDLCEIARRRRDDAAQRARDLVDSERMKALGEEREFHEQYLETSEALYELQIEHHHLQAGRVEEMLRRAQEDKHHLGKAWDKRAEGRLDRIENRLNRTIVEMLKTQCRRLADQKDRALLDMAVVEEGPEMEAAVREKEDLVYRIQLRLYEIQLRLLEEEECRLRLQERYAEGEEKEGIQRRMERIPSKMSKIRLRMQTCKEQQEDPGRRTINAEESYAAQFAAQKKEAVTKREVERKRQFMKEQRQKTIQRVKEYMEKNPVPAKKLPPRYQRPARKQPITRKKPGPSPHTQSRVSTTAGLTKSVYKTKSSSEGKATSRDAMSKKAKGKGVRGGLAARKAEATEPSSKLPPVARPPENIQTLNKAAQDLPPPPPPPPPPPAQPLPPPTRPIPTPRQRSPATQKPSKPGGGVAAGIDLTAILNARVKLKRTELGQRLEQGGMTSTAEEVACLVRSGATAATSSLTQDGASFLRRRIQHINTVTQVSDSESDSDWDPASA